MPLTQGLNIVPLNLSFDTSFLLDKLSPIQECEASKESENVQTRPESKLQELAVLDTRSLQSLDIQEPDATSELDIQQSFILKDPVEIEPLSLPDSPSLISEPHTLTYGEATEEVKPRLSQFTASQVFEPRTFEATETVEHEIPHETILSKNMGSQSSNSLVEAKPANIFGSQTPESPQEVSTPEDSNVVPCLLSSSDNNLGLYLPYPSSSSEDDAIPIPVSPRGTRSECEAGSIPKEADNDSLSQTPRLKPSPRRSSASLRRMYSSIKGRVKLTIGKMIQNQELVVKGEADLYKAETQSRKA
ncbi:hypothetical protein DSO57_1023123 [Entomophthora muscae]|uniref:Uncharacterized protein n=1 Tax=Entomophthora muscae TaxID=34485 RepID=A0ACC2UCF3_9FUNG|nr:hypothetical protein DSO57_1023123 [Entomophthora muscae]